MATPENEAKIKYLSRYISLNRRIDRLLDRRTTYNARFICFALLSQKQSGIPGLFLFYPDFAVR